MSYTNFANAICHKTQKAAQEMVKARIVANGLESLLPAESVFAGIGGGLLTAKRVVCECKNAVAAEPWEGNWMADLKIQVRCPHEDISEDDFHELAGQIFAFFFQSKSDVETRLSNATIKYTAQFVIPRRASWDIENEGDADAPSHVWVSEVEFQVLCSGSVID
jgi:hypothetical protein